MIDGIYRRTTIYSVVIFPILNSTFNAIVISVFLSDAKLFLLHFDKYLVYV